MFTKKQLKGSQILRIILPPRGSSGASLSDMENQEQACNKKPIGILN